MMYVSTFLLEVFTRAELGFDWIVILMILKVVILRIWIKLLQRVFI